MAFKPFWTTSPSPRRAGRASKARRRLPRALGPAALVLWAIASSALAETVFDRLYPGGHGRLVLPYPFSRLVADIKVRTGADIQLAFVPLGRSLQRYAADPHYFASPRILLAVTGNGKTGPSLRDRLFMGYQPAVGAIEIIAFDEAEGRFHFMEVNDYGPQGRPTTAAVEEDVCATCHQARGPIFPATPWDETNANPRVAAALPPIVEGLAVRQDFDGLDQFSRSVQRANRLLVATQLKRALAGQDIASLTKAFPQGVAVIEPKIPNRDPLALIAAGLAIDKTLATDGVLAPESRRLPVLIWKPGLTAAEDAARLIEEAERP